jgi:excisionase family DNA binding protein
MTDDTSRTGRDPDVLTTAELAAKLGLSAQTVRRMANAGQLPALKTGKDFRYSWSAVKEKLRQPHTESESTPADDTDPPQPGAVRSLDAARQGAGYRAQRRATAEADQADTTDDTSERAAD